MIFIGGGSDAWDRIQDANGGLVVAFFCVAGTVTLVSTARWRVVIRALLSIPGPPFSILYVQVMAGRVVGLFIPRAAADVGIRIIALQQYTKASLGRATTSVIIDSLMDVAIVGLFGALGILFLTGVVSAPVATAIIAAIAFVSLVAAPMAISSVAKSTIVPRFTGPGRRLRVSRLSRGASERPEWPDALRRLGRFGSTAVWALTLLRFALGTLHARPLVAFRVEALRPASAQPTLRWFTLLAHEVLTSLRLAEMPAIILSAVDECPLARMKHLIPLRPLLAEG